MEIDVIIVYIRESVYKNNRNVIFSVREEQVREKSQVEPEDALRDGALR